MLARARKRIWPELSIGGGIVVATEDVVTKMDAFVTKKVGGVTKTGTALDLYRNRPAEAIEAV
jgi:hypothetical protein